MVCKKCGKEVRVGAKFCTGCGEPVSMPIEKPITYNNVYQKNRLTHTDADKNVNTETNGLDLKPQKNKKIAALLAIFFGSFGLHKFYMGKPGVGLIYIIFICTPIPIVLGIIEGIMYLVESEDRFNSRCR